VKGAQKQMLHGLKTQQRIRQLHEIVPWILAA
jgi:hypothetical protein